jgi:hypothetical protein
MATEYGTDFACVEDLDAKLSLASGPRMVAEAVVRRLSTPRGGLWYDPAYGTDLRGYLNGASSRFRVASDVEREALKDERVAAAAASVTRSASTLSVAIELTLETGVTFDLTLSVSELTVELVDFDEAA